MGYKAAKVLVQRNLPTNPELRPKGLHNVDHIFHIPQLAHKVDGSTGHYPVGCGRFV
jgi:hypothetical protein